MRRFATWMLGTVLAVTVFATGATAQANYPDRPIKLIIPFPPGGITDLSGRIVADGLRAKLGQPVVVENKPGANGLLGLREMLKHEPDGYTIMVGNVASVILNYALDPNVGFDPMKDMVPIAGTSEYATTMVVNAATPVNSIAEFVAYAKERQGKLSYGSTGVGSLANLATRLFMRQTGIEMVHVPYRGGPLAMNDLLGGQIQLIIEVSPVVQEQVKAGKLKGLAVTSPYRQPGLPKVPTFKEAGVEGMEVTGWLGLYGPPDLPEDIRKRLAAVTVQIVKEPEYAARLRAIAFEPTGQDMAAFTAHHASEFKRWVAFYKAMGLTK